MKLNRGTFDTMPLSLITTRTVESLGALLGTDLDVLRFRPNLVIEAFGAAAFPEDEWVGQALTVGTTWMRIDGRDKRCVVVNVDPVTGRRDPDGATRYRHPPGDMPRRVRIDDSSRAGCGRRLRGSAAMKDPRPTRSGTRSRRGADKHRTP